MLGKNEKRRKAYLSLWEKFVMSGEQSSEIESGFSPLPPLDITLYMVSPAGKGAIIISSTAAAAFQKITKGVSETTLDDWLNGCILEEGELIITADKNTRRRYFQIGDNAQFWVELSRTPAGWLVDCRSPLENKTVWHRYPNNQINLPLE